MRRLLLSAALAAITWPLLAAPPLKVSGTVREAGSGEPVTGAVVRLDENYLWAITDTDGAFVMDRAEKGRYQLEVSCLGYVTHTRMLDVKASVTDLVIELSPNTLALNEVVVTAEKSKDNINTTQVIGRTALDHLQMNSMGGISALLPGGKTINPEPATPPSPPPWKSTGCAWATTPASAA